MIEKLLALVLIMTYVIWSFTAQPVVPMDKLTQQIKVIGEKHDINVAWTQEKIHDAIVSAGEQNGWIMTEFKSNALIAEKLKGDNTVAVTVKFDKSFFSILPANSELKSAITAMLQ